MFSLRAPWRFRSRHNDVSSTSTSTTDQDAQDEHSTQPSSCFLLKLPVELLLKIYMYLRVIDVLAIARTCHILRQLATNQHRRVVDVRDFDWTDWPRYKRRLRKDKCYKFMEAQSPGATSNMSICGECLAPHPNHYFDASELLRDDPFARICRARTMPVRVCEHREIYYDDVVEMMLSDETYIRQCSRHQKAASQSYTDTVNVSLRRSYPINNMQPVTNTTRSDRATKPIVLEILFPRPVFKELMSGSSPDDNWMLCRHFNLRAVLEEFKSCQSEPRDVLDCSACFTTFEKYTEDSGESLLLVRRDLGYGGDVPDAACLAAVGVKRCRLTCAKSSEKRKRSSALCTR